MTAPNPPDAERFVLAAVVPCNMHDTKFTANGDIATVVPCIEWPGDRDCNNCNGDGTRTVVTDIAVEPRDATSGDTTVRVWLER